MIIWIPSKVRRVFGLLCVTFPLAALTFSFGLAGSLDPIVGLLIAVLPLLGVYVLSRDIQQRIERMTARVHALAANQDVPAPDRFEEEMLGPPTLADLQQALTGLELAQRFRARAFESRSAAHENLVEKLPDPLIVVDGKREVLRANHAARELFGERMVARDLAASVRHPEILEAVDAVRGGGTSRFVEFTIPVPVERIFEARIKPFPFAVEVGESAAVSASIGLADRSMGQPMAATALVVAPGIVSGSGEGPGLSASEIGQGGNGQLGVALPAMITLHDITAMKRSERMRADFVGNASHELRTPLTGLIGFIQTLRGAARDDPDAQERFLSIMETQATRMSRLVDDLLSLSRIEQDEHTPPTGRVDLVAEVQAVIDAFELRAAARSVRLRVHIATAVPPVLGDAHQLGQVLQNLISNAIKYSHEQTEVLVTVACTDGAAVGGLTPLPLPARRRGGGRPATRRFGQFVSVAVTDRGEGIERMHLPRLTERFYRVDAARSRKLGGTGLGLAIVKHILNRHRGRLTIESELGKGSTFTIYLPVTVSEGDLEDAPETRVGAA